MQNSHLYSKSPEAEDFSSPPGPTFYIFSLCFCGSTSKTAVSHSICIIIYCDSIFHEDSLHETGSCRNPDSLILPGIIGQLRKDMTFIIRKEIVTVNDSHCVIQLQTELESQSASRIAFQNPSFFHLHPQKLFPFPFPQTAAAWWFSAAYS